ncbi:hypothetical protein [Streptomyces sp. NPDC059744]|uniref:hypothetical protein n=1 Tax=Streptomyces sp. NPDC059744 TaxID=3346929 RepID=UPI00365A615E
MPTETGSAGAEQVVHERYEFFGDRVRYPQPDPLDVPSLAARAAAHPGRVAAVEALWGGDTVHDWFVLLVAVLEDPSAPPRPTTPPVARFRLMSGDSEPRAFVIEG